MGILVDPVPPEAHWQMGQIEVNTRYLRVMGYRTMTDIHIPEEDMQMLLDELCDAKNELISHNGYMPRQWVFGRLPRVPGHVLDENPDLPNMDPEGHVQDQARLRDRCRRSAIGGGVSAA